MAAHRHSLRTRWGWWRWINWRTRRASLRAFWHHVVRNYRYEICRECGKPTEVVWWCPDQELWDRINGGPAGIMCVRCFDGACKEEGDSRRWIAAPLMDAITITLDPDRNERLHQIARKRGETPEQIAESLLVVFTEIDKMDLDSDETRALLNEILDSDELDDEVVESDD